MTHINIRVEPESKYADLFNRIVVTNRTCKVCGDKFYYRAGQYSGMPDNNSCHSCQFWVEKVAMRNHLNVARINGEHYVLGEQLTGNGRGMGGDKHVIKFFDGRVKTCVDLWHQGTIPAEFSAILPNNAEFAEVQ